MFIITIVGCSPNYSGFLVHKVSPISMVGGHVGSHINHSWFASSQLLHGSCTSHNEKFILLCSLFFEVSNMSRMYMTLKWWLMFDILYFIFYIWYLIFNIWYLLFDDPLYRMSTFVWRGCEGLLITTLGLLTTMTILLLAIIRDTFVSLVSFVEDESCMSYDPNLKYWIFPWAVGCRILNLSLQTALFCTLCKWLRSGPLAICVEGVCCNSSV